MSSFLILALASSALAVPFGGEPAHQKHRHQNHAHPSGSGFVGYSGTGAPYSIANATGIWGPSAGTAASTGFPVSSGYSSVSAPVAAVSTSCSQSTAYVTQTNQFTVTIYPSSTANSSSAASEAGAASSTGYIDLSNKAYNDKQRWHRKSTTSASSGKRGVAYNDASLCTPFESSSEVSWGYNWGQSSSGLSSKFNYVPLLWGTGSTFTNGWADTVSSAAADGVTHLMSFNEPDMTSQANLSPEDAAAAFKQHMQPYAGDFKLGSPAVTNGGDGMGLDWLDAFLTACDGCDISFIPIHWYDSPSHTEYFQEHVANASTVAGGKPIWVTEFGVTSGSDSDISTFLETVMPWMDSQDYVERYAYFMVADGYLVSGDETSSYGSTYSSYTSSS